MNLKVKAEEGKKFAIYSGDNNPIHLDDVTGYNSMFGEKICHGCLVILKFFYLINLDKIIKDKKKYSIKILFLKHFSYEKKINIIRKKNKFFFYQSRLIVAELKINFENNFSNFILGGNKNFTITARKKKELYNSKNLSFALCNLSMFVGTIYPGKNSIIREISINYNKEFDFSKKKISIFSKKKDSRYPLIYNKLLFKNYNIEFQTLIRPKLKPSKIKLSKKIKNLVNKMNDRILIIGAGSGIGKELLDIFKVNKKLDIIATYHKNKFSDKNKNIKIIKLDIEKSIKKIKKICNNKKKLKVYYFATPKIDLDIKEKKYINRYKKFFIKYPLDILNSFKGNRIEFFYPSTIYVDKIKSKYSMIKKIAEKKLKMICSKNIKINLLRIDEVNTKQNLTVFDKNLPSFTQLLDKNKHYQDKIFFTN